VEQQARVENLFSPQAQAAQEIAVLFTLAQVQRLGEEEER